MDATKIAQINARRRATSRTCPTPTSPPLVAGRQLRATTDMRELGAIGRHRHLRADAAPQDQGSRPVVHRPRRRGVAATLERGQLIILESTTYPGTTDEVVQPMLEKTGLKADVDFFLAFSPERVDPGNQQFHTTNIPKVVGGVGAARARRRRCALYGATVDTVVPVSSTRVAEMVKLLENTFRAVNIGLVNEIALMCDRMDIDVWEVIDAAETKPFGFMPFYPGPGLGGHCIPIDPFYLSWKARQNGFECRFIELAGQVNSSMPQYVVERVAEALNSDAQADQRIARAPARRGVQARRQRHARVAGARHHGAAQQARGAASATPIRTSVG